MSIENSVLGHNSRKERKDSQFNTVKRLIREDLPSRIRKNISGANLPVIILGRGTDRAIPIFVSPFEKKESTLRMVSVKEEDLRKYSDAYMTDLSRYFPEELLITDITYENNTHEEIFNILDLGYREDGRILMVRDQQVELEYEMFDECYYFLVDIEDTTDI